MALTLLVMSNVHRLVKRKKVEVNLNASQLAVLF